MKETYLWIPKWEKSFQGGVIKIANTPEQIYSNRGLLIMLLIMLLIRADVTFVCTAQNLVL